MNRSFSKPDFSGVFARYNEATCAAPPGRTSAGDTGGAHAAPVSTHQLKP
jgi:hypothetical protein